MENGYTINELLGREKTFALLSEKAQLVAVEDKFAPYDVTGSTLTKNFYIEVKNRMVKSDDYDTDLLEYSKLKGMQNVEPNALHFYLCFFTDGVARLYHLNKIKIQDVYIDIKNCPVSSVENKGIKQKICYELPIHLAKTYKLN